MRPFAILLAITAAITPASAEAVGGLIARQADGSPLGSCPLTHTAADVEISGNVARVSVTQRFHNPFAEIIEAVYRFPLHHDAAVDEMTLTVGGRLIEGRIKKRDEALQIYQNARSRGETAALLEQERPNLFTQSVANLEPGHEISVTLRYSQTLAWRDGRYQFEFPTVVGPRYVPGGSNRQQPPDPQLADADRVTAPVAAAGHRAGHDFSISLRIQAGLPITEVTSPLHAIRVEHPEGDPTRARVTLQEDVALPDRDFTLSYATAGDGITDAILTHTDERGSFFSITLQPPPRVPAEEIVPRELIFVLDTSGSMSGFPLETSKSLMRRALESLRPADRFNLLTFAGETRLLFKEPVANTPANRTRALEFIASLEGGNGTEMMTAVEAALGAGHDADKLRIVCFLTDGYVSNEVEILAAVKRHASRSRVFTLGIGSSVNRYLIEGMAHAGRGASYVVLRPEDAPGAADLLYQRIESPVLTDISLDFDGLAVEEVFPAAIGDLFAAGPVVVKGRYTRAGSGTLQLRGRTAAGAFTRTVEVTFPEKNPENPVLAAQWARAKVDHLTHENLGNPQRGVPGKDAEEEITKLGLAYHLLTRFTSFVAVESRTVTGADGRPKTVVVPLELPQGMNRHGVFGDEAAAAGMGGGGGFSNIPAMMRKRCGPEDRIARLATEGGTPAVDTAIGQALTWLKQQQNPDGGWGGADSIELTGLALLAYLGRCENVLSHHYGDEILNAMLYLIRAANANGGLLSTAPGGNLPDTSHAIATYALAEAAVIARQLKVNLPGMPEAVQAAGQAILNAQRPDGSWPVGDGGDPVLLAATNLHALKACHLTGLDFKGLQKAVGNALDYLKSAAVNEGGFTHPGPVAVAHQFWAKGDSDIVRQATAAIATRGPFQWDPASAAALHAEAHAMLHRGGESWTTYNAAFLPAMLKAQEPDGSFKPAPEPADEPSSVIRATCHATLAMEVYFRYLPSTHR